MSLPICLLIGFLFQIQNLNVRFDLILQIEMEMQSAQTRKESAWERGLKKAKEVRIAFLLVFAKI